MTPTQIQHWDEARQRSDFTNYDNQVKRPNIRASSAAPDIGYKIVNENEYEGNFQKFLVSAVRSTVRDRPIEISPDSEKIKEMQYKINLLTQTVNELEKLPVDELQKENEILKSENADLEEQVKFINENYERHQEEKLKIENYLADLEETIEEKEKVHKNFHPISQTATGLPFGSLLCSRSIAFRPLFTPAGLRKVLSTSTFEKDKRTSTRI